VRWRPTAVEDLETALAIDPYSVGDEIVGRSRALAAYAELVRTRRALSAVVELPGHQSPIVGFGAAFFVAESFVCREVSNPRPGFNARLIESIGTPEPVVLTHDEIRRCNTEGGLTLAITHAGWTPTLGAEQVSALEGVMAYAFLQLIRGFKLLRLVREAGSQGAIDHVRRQHIFATMLRFDDYQRAHPDSRWNTDRALFVAERADCLALPASVAAMVFSHAEPTLQLHDEDQDLLLAALEGMTDTELSRALGLKLATVKKRWAALFERVRLVRPDLVPDPQNDSLETRGPQKRHRLLAYVRQHPEELRPRLRTPHR
jgi:hypothetical protein